MWSDESDGAFRHTHALGGPVFFITENLDLSLSYRIQFNVSNKISVNQTNTFLADSVTSDVENNM